MKKTFADRAKQIMNKYKKRLGDNFDKGDKLALEAMNQELEALRQEQEAVRMAAGIVEAEQAQGLPLHAYGDFLVGAPEDGAPQVINKREPEKIVQNMGERSALGQFLTGNRYRLKTVEKKGKGGKLAKYEDGGPIQLPPALNLSPLNPLQGTVNTTSPPTNLSPKSYTIDPDFSTRWGRLMGKLGSLGGSPMQEGDLYKSRVPWMGAAAGIVGNLLMNKKVDLPTYDYQEYTPDKVGANLVNFGREREQVMNERDLAQQMIANNARGTGSMAGLMDNIQAGATGTQREAGTRFGQSLQNEGTMNAQIQNQADQFNASQGLAAAGMNERNRMFAKNMERENMMINADRRDSRIKGISDSVTGYFKDRLRADQYDTSLHLAAPDNTEWQVGRDSNWRRLLGISPVINRATVNTEDDALIGGNAYGGELGSISLFGDDKYEKIMMRANKFKQKTKNKK